MTFFEDDTKYYEEILFMGFAVIAFVLFFVQILYLQELKLIPVYLLPFLSFCVCFDNICMYRQGHLNSRLEDAAYFFQACIDPLFFMIVYEVPYRLHETRLAHFGCVPFEQGHEVPTIARAIAIWGVRIIAAALFVFHILANYDIVDDRWYAGRGGYVMLKDHTSSVQVWFSLVPSMATSAMAIYISFLLYKYGKHCTLGTANNKFWRAIIPCSLLYAVGHCFDENVFGVTSNAAQVVLLIGTTITVGLVQRDLVIAGSFAAFLHKSNEAFTAAVPERRNSAAGAASGGKASGSGDGDAASHVEMTAAAGAGQVAVVVKTDVASAV